MCLSGVQENIICRRRQFQILPTKRHDISWESSAGFSWNIIPYMLRKLGRFRKICRLLQLGLALSGFGPSFVYSILRHTSLVFSSNRLTLECLIVFNCPTQRRSSTWLHPTNKIARVQSPTFIQRFTIQLVDGCIPVKRFVYCFIFHVFCRTLFF